jgi:hypothetical protein
MGEKRAARDVLAVDNAFSEDFKQTKNKTAAPYYFDNY